MEKNGIICPRGNLSVSLNKTGLILKLWFLYLLVRINDFSLTKKMLFAANNIHKALSGCTHGHYGDNCGEVCACDIDNTELCNPNNGTCTCRSGWQGGNCSVDVDECSDKDMYTCPAHSSCKNVEGSYRCQCEIGFEKSGSVCIGRNMPNAGSSLCLKLYKKK